MKNLSKDLLGGNEELIAAFLVLILEHEPVTQDEIMMIAETSRAPVSRALAMMEELKIVQITKKSGDRKKYYKSVTNLQDYGGGKLTRVLSYYSQMQMMMRTKFLPDLEKIEVKENKEQEEKLKLKLFFEENLHFFDIFISFSKSMHLALGEELKNYMISIKSSV